MRVPHAFAAVLNVFRRCGRRRKIGAAVGGVQVEVAIRHHVDGVASAILHDGHVEE